jgi:cell pole-organizing protein PopZ
MSDTPKPSATPDSADPSMEDILASIRRILNEEEAPEKEDAPPAASNDEDEDVLMLDESMMVAAGVPEPDAAPRQPDREAEPDPEPAAPKAGLSARDIDALMASDEPVIPVVPTQPMPTSDLMAPETAAAAASSVGSLMRTLAAGRATQVYSGGPTLEDIVRAELRPLLKEWLDSNLPPLVERLVRAEIERVVGRAVP